MESTLKIDVEGLKKSLLQRRPMKARFKLPMTEEQAYACLLAAIMAEVEYRHRTFCTNEYLEKRLNEMAHWLTSPSSYFGILLCGGCGNGKSTMLKAFQQLLNSLHIPKLDNDGTYGIQIVDAILHICARTTMRHTADLSALICSALMTLAQNHLRCWTMATSIRLSLIC